MYDVLDADLEMFEKKRFYGLRSMPYFNRY